MQPWKKEIQREVRSIRRELIFANIAILALGFLLALYPETSGSVICRVVGVVLCMAGLLRCVAYFREDKTEAFGSFALVQGAAMLGFGIYFVVRPASLAAFLTVVLAIVLIVGGVMKLQYGFDLARFQVTGWWIELIGALLTAALGILVFVNPFEAAETLMIFIGIAFIVDAVWDLLSIFYLSRTIKKYKTALKEGAAEIDVTIEG